VVLYIGSDTAWYGDKASQQLRVYRMNEPDFKIDSNYRYNRPLSYDPAKLLADATVYPVYPKDSIDIYGTKQAPQLHIKLNNAFGNELFQLRADGAFLSDSAFNKWLGGLAIVPDTSSGMSRTMLFPNLNSGDTRISVYYRNSEKDSIIANFPFVGSPTCVYRKPWLLPNSGSEKLPSAPT
jgi:hypothetical protein